MPSLFLRMLKESAQGLLSIPRWQGQVVMFHNSRCGSTVLGNLLRQHPLISWDGEVFIGTYANVLAKYFEQNHPSLYLRQRRFRAAAPLYGFEFKPYLHSKNINIPPSQFLEQLSSPEDNYYIQLTRKNNLRRYVSIQVSKKAGKWNISPEEQPELTRVNLDTSKLLGYLEYMNEEDKELKEFLEGKPVLHLSYEDHILEDPRIGYRLVCGFLGIEPVDVTVHNRKMNPFPLADLVENFDEVEGALSETPYEWMLHAD